MTKTITITLKDAKGKTGNIECSLPTGTGQITAVNFAEDLCVAINEFTLGTFISCKITDTVDISGLDINLGAADAAADVEEGALFTFRTDAGHFTRMRIPTLNEDMVMAGTDVIDLADTNIDAFVDLMVDGLVDVVNGDALPSDSRDEDIVSVASAKEVFRSS